MSENILKDEEPKQEIKPEPKKAKAEKAEPKKELSGSVALIREGVTIIRDAGQVAEYLKKGWAVK